MKKGFAHVFLILGIVVVGIIAAIFLAPKNISAPISPTVSPIATTGTTPMPPENTGACTMDAKQCPDGSYVSRSGPKCEFATCPPTPTDGPIRTPISSPTPTPTQNDLERKSYLEIIIRPSLELYRSDYNEYPSELSEMVPKYLKTLPQGYLYTRYSNKIDYSLSTKFENGEVYTVKAPQ